MKDSTENALFNAFRNRFPLLAEYWNDFAPVMRPRHVDAKTILLPEGEKARYLFLVLEGCLRIYFIKKDGRDITAQFFLPGQMVGSMESLFTGLPSKMYLEAVEDSDLACIAVDDFRGITSRHEPLKDMMADFFRKRLLHYMGLHMTFISMTPEERYLHLLETEPEIMDRLPHHYIASYIGITPVSLSRIRSRLEKKSR